MTHAKLLSKIYSGRQGVVGSVHRLRLVFYGAFGKGPGDRHREAGRPMGTIIAEGADGILGVPVFWPGSGVLAGKYS